MNARTKAYEEKIRKELEQVKSRLSEPEARSKAEDEQVAIDLINQLKRTHGEIKQEREKLKTSAVEEINEEKAVIDAGIAKLKAGLKQLDTRLKRAA